jgi:hypothetical protein
MAYKIKRTGIIIWAFVILSASALGAYQYKDDITDGASKIVEKVTPWYTSKYSIEEMSDKIFSQQQKLSEKLKEAYESQLTVIKDVRITWDMNMSLDMNSSVWWGDGKMNFSGLDFQYKDDNIDLAFDELSLGWKMEAIGVKLESSWLFKNIHLLQNETASFLKIENNSVESDFFPEDFLMTLNQLWKQEKYIQLSNNQAYKVFQTELAKQTDDSSIHFLLDFMENEKIFKVNKQEDTKYFLVPSEALCKLMKKEKKNIDTEIDIPEEMTYESYKNSFKECNEEEYSEFIVNFMKSDYHELKNLYIEYSPTKVHYVFDMELIYKDSWNTTVEENLETVFNIGSDVTFSLWSIEESKSYLNIEGGWVTWSGIILTTNRDAFDMLLDIDMERYELDTNMSFSGTTDSYNMNWNYSVVFVNKMDNYLMRAYEWMRLSWNIDSRVSEWNTTFIMQNNFNEPKNGINWKLLINSSSELDGDRNIWNALITGELKPWDWASSMSWDLNILWDTIVREDLSRWNIEYKLNIPNIATADYLLNYDFKISNEIESSFETPKNIILEDELEKMLSRNRIIADKKKIIENKKKIEELKKGNNTFWSYSIEAMNSKVTSDLRTLVSAIETLRTRESIPLKDLLRNSKIIKSDSNYTIYSWNIDFKTLRQNWNDFISPYSWEDYEFRVIIITDEKGTISFSGYQIWWYRYDNDKYAIKEIWNYYKLSPELPESLFDIEVE